MPGFRGLFEKLSQSALMRGTAKSSVGRSMSNASMGLSALSQFPLSIQSLQLDEPLSGLPPMAEQAPAERRECVLAERDPSLSFLKNINCLSRRAACALGLAAMEVLMHSVQYVSPDALKPNPRNARTHSKRQIRQIADSIVAYGFTVPVLIDENSMLLAGHGRLEAAKLRRSQENTRYQAPWLKRGAKASPADCRQQNRRECRLGRVPALDGAHGAIQRSVGEQHALPARELEDESFENLPVRDMGFTKGNEWKRSKGRLPDGCTGWPGDALMLGTIARKLLIPSSGVYKFAAGFRRRLQAVRIYGLFRPTNGR